MPNPPIPKDEVHAISEACGTDLALWRGIARRLMDEQPRLTGFVKRNVTAVDRTTAEVSLYLYSVVLRIFEQKGGKLRRVRGEEIDAAVRRIQGHLDRLMPFDDGFPERLRAVEWRAQPNILEEALEALFLRKERKEEEVEVPRDKAGLIFMMLWAATEALDAAWQPPKGS